MREWLGPVRGCFVGGADVLRARVRVCVARRILLTVLACVTQVQRAVGGVRRGVLEWAFVLPGWPGVRRGGPLLQSVSASLAASEEEATGARGGMRCMLLRLFWGIVGV